jgi:hypothetical protein
MKIFLSWSEERGKAIATALKSWLPLVIQASEPWMSTETPTGAQWSSAIVSNLKDAGVGVICVTPESLDSRWLNFEAGALAVMAAAEPRRKVCPYLWDVSPGDISGPLAEYQAQRADKEGTYRLVRTLNESLSRPLADSILERQFKLSWNLLEQDLSKIPKAPPVATPKIESPTMLPGDKLDEILLMVRQLSREVTLVRQLNSTEQSPVPQVTWSRPMLRHLLLQGSHAARPHASDADAEDVWALMEAAAEELRRSRGKQDDDGSDPAKPPGSAK